VVGVTGARACWRPVGEGWAAPGLLAQAA